VTERRIYKWPLPIIGKAIVDMPHSPNILAVQAQNNVPCVWALCEPSNPLQSHVFHMYMTGELLPGAMTGTYLATVQLRGGYFVTHVFYEGPTYAG
jgi:hypothetical protein